MNRQILTLGCAAMIMGAAAQTTQAQTTVTSFADETNTTPGVWFTNDVRPGGTASVEDLTGLGGDLETNQPLPLGAALVTTNMTNEAKGEVGVLGDYGTPNDTFASLNLSYWYHKAVNAGQNAAGAPSLKLAFYNPACPSQGDCYGELVYEPYWNQATPGVSTNPPEGAWTQVTIDDTNGVFWTTGMFGEANSAGGPPLRTLAEWLTTFEQDFGTSTLIRVSIGVGSYNQGQAGYFDNVSISHSTLTESYDFEPEGAGATAAGGTVATFNVTRNYSDGNDAASEVTLNCNGGLPLHQSYDLAGGAAGGVTFTVKEFVEGETRCEVTQSGTFDGYSTQFNNGTVTTADSCIFEPVTAGDYQCAISSTLQLVPFYVNIDWNATPGADGIESEVEFTVFCENVRSGPSGGLISLEETFYLSEEVPELIGAVFPNYTTPASRCRFETEPTNSAVEMNDGCADWTYVQVGDESASCTVEATVFFEGIPTLSRMGMMIMVLLLMGAGLVGFRRFA